MAISGDGWNHGTGSKTTDLGGASPGGPTPIGGYIKVSPVNIESFTISTNLGTLTKSDFILTGTYYEYYNLNLTSVQSASATGYTTSITKTSSYDEPIYNIVFHPTRLYAWTDPSASTETLYAWYNSLYDCIFWTTTTTPDTSVSIYDVNGNDITEQYCPGYPGDEFSSASSERLIYRMATSGVHYLPSEHVLFNGSSGTANFNRDSTKDITISTSATLYTTTPTVEVGTKLYDAEGIDTGKTVFQINQDGSFDITLSSIVLSVGFQSNGGAAEGVPTTTTINGDSITVPNSGSVDVTVNANESCTIVITTGNSGLRGWIYVNGIVAASNFGTITYTFTPTANCVVGVGRSYDPE